MNKRQAPSVQNFGEFFRQKRIQAGFTLRAFCERYSFDPGNISKLERNKLSPTLDPEKLEGYALALKISRSTPDWITFFDLAHISRGAFPPDIKNDQNLISMLPAFCRTVRGKKLSRDKIKKLIELLNNS